jgi:peptidoglycan-N-acetylglucosamine deacetylase
MSSSWQAAPAIKASVVLHGAALLGTAAMPAIWPWALAALAANQIILTAAGLTPRASLLGANLTRLGRAATERGYIALTIDDGPDPEVTPLVLDQLDAAGARASFFCIGWRARQYPALCREIVRRGHRVENHGDAHSALFATLGPRRMLADIQAAQMTLSDLSGQAPRFFRPMAGLRNPFLDWVLHELALQLATWTRRSFDTRTGDPQQVLQRLTRRLAAGDILLMHDGNAARTAAGKPVILEVLPRLLAVLDAHKLRTVTLAEEHA